MDIRWRKKIEVSDYGKVGLRDSLELKLSKDKTFSFSLTSKSGFKSTKTITIKVADRSDIIEFKADKLYTLPGVPVTISWKVKNAKSIKLNDAKVPIEGMSIFFPDSDKVYTLLVKDDFGTETQSINIRMLPIPLINCILVKTPTISKTVNIQLNPPQFETIPNIPLITTDFVKLECPPLPEIKFESLQMKLKPTPQFKLTKRISQFIKNIFR